MESFVKAFADEGITVDVSEKPLFTLIGAKDGVIFYINQQKVAIYEYESKKQLNEVISQLPLPDIATWQTNGNFLLETQNELAAKIFNKTK